MSQFISVPCKKGHAIKLTDIISSYVKDVYGEEQYSYHDSAFTKLGNMRTTMLKKLTDKHESTLNTLTRYHDQFYALETKIPIEESGMRIDFKWDDAFAKDSLFGKKGFLKIASGGYERICVLFNIAAMYSQVAETSNLSDDVGLKNAVKYFQQAAGIFAYLKLDVPNIINREPTIDLNGDTLSTLNMVMLAQAQELIYTKAVRDSHQDGNIAKISQQLSDLYADALKLMQLNSVKSIWPKDWIPIVAGKQAGYHAMAEYYQGKACGVNQDFGERIARFKKSTGLMKTTSARAWVKFLFRSEEEKLKRELDTAENENNFIYRDKVMDISSLSLVPKHLIAREIPIENPMNKDFKDIFENIIPLNVHSTITMFHNKLFTTINAETYRLKKETNALTCTMASMNLPRALNHINKDDVPSDLLLQAAIVRKAGGVKKIEQLLYNLCGATTRNIEILNESAKMLDEEEEADVNLRKRFNERWNRTPSGKMTKKWYGELQKFKVLIQRAKTSDDDMCQLYKEHFSPMYTLSQSQVNVKASILALLHSTSTENEILRKLCSDLEAVKSSRLILIQDITNLKRNNISTLFSKAIAKNPSLNQEQFVDEQINNMLYPFWEKVRDSVNAQTKLVGQLQEKSSQWNTSESSGGNRAAVISSLMLAFDKFHELKNNLEEGLKFYGDLTDILLKFQNKVKYFCLARETEKEDLLKELQTTFVVQKTKTSAAINDTIQATSDGTKIRQQQSVPIPNQSPTRPPPDYQNVAAGPTGAPMMTGALAAQHKEPRMNTLHPTNPDHMPPAVGYIHGVPYSNPYPHRAQQAPMMKQPDQILHSMSLYPYPPWYETYPGYNPYYPR